MELNVRNLVFSGAVGGIVGLALTMNSRPELAGVLLGTTLGIISLYASSMEGDNK